MQKAQRLGLMFALLISLMMVASTAMAQRVTVGTLLTGLLNVNVSDIDIETGDITVINVENVDVLRNADIQFLNNSINNNSVLSDNQVTITDLLREADIITDNQIVVGILSGPNLTVFVQDVVAP